MKATPDQLSPPTDLTRGEAAHARLHEHRERLGGQSIAGGTTL